MGSVTHPTFSGPRIVPLHTDGPVTNPFLKPASLAGMPGQCLGVTGVERRRAVCSKLNAPKLGVRQRAEGRSLSWQRAEPAPVCRDMPKLACRGIPKLVCEGVRAVGHKPDTPSKGGR